FRFAENISDTRAACAPLVPTWVCALSVPTWACAPFVPTWVSRGSRGPFDSRSICRRARARAASRAARALDGARARRDVADAPARTGHEPVSRCPGADRLRGCRPEVGRREPSGSALGSLVLRRHVRARLAAEPIRVADVLVHADLRHAARRVADRAPDDRDRSRGRI